MAFNIRTKQCHALKQLLNLNEQVSESALLEATWKVLIFDDVGQNIISPLLSIKELRDLGVTLHMHVTSVREILPEVPAVYFIAPTGENVALVSRDFSSGLYESYYLNFITALPRQHLEDLATAAVQNQCGGQINKVYDQYLDFISLEEDLFVLEKHNPTLEGISYYAMNRSSVTEDSINDIITKIVDGLFSVCVTLGVVPIIRCPKGNAAEMVAERLDKKLRDNLRDARNNLFTTENIRAGQLSFQRPVLVILDRNLDMATPLHHTWTYQALAHDLLGLELNRIVLEEVSGPAGIKRKTKEYYLNPSDKFWVAEKGNPFPVVAEAVQEELESYRSSEEEIQRLKNAMGLNDQDDAAISMIGDTTQKLTSTVSSLPQLLEKKRLIIIGLNDQDDAAISMIGDTTQKLTSTVSSLPQLLEKKRLIDMHTNIATAILEHIKQRKLDEYFETEEKIMNHQTAVGSLNELLRNPEFGSKEDKLRLFLMSFICGEFVDQNDSVVSDDAGVLEELGCDTSALKFLKRWKSFAKAPAFQDQYAGGGTKTVNMFSKLLNQSSQLVMEGVKNLVIKKHNLPFTKILDAIMEMKSNSDVDDYRYFDPKLLRPNTGGTVPRNRSPFQEAMVFVVGGGNYIEYQNLMDYKKVKSNANQTKRIVYGATDMINADAFLAQLTRLGQEI